MNIRYLPLCTVAINHGYYAGGCRDFTFLIPPTTQRKLRAAKLLARELDGVLHVLFEADKNGLPVAGVAAETLLFGLRLNNPNFANFTKPLPIEAAARPLYINATGAASFNPPTGVLLAANRYSHHLHKTVRPVVLRLSDAGGRQVVASTVVANDAEVVLDLRALSAGFYTLSEDYGAPGKVDSTLLLEPGWGNQAPWGVLAIAIDPSFYDPKATPAAFAISLKARAERLQYFVVANNYSATQFADLFSQLKVVNAGVLKDTQGNSVVFDKLDQPAIESRFPGFSGTLLAGGGSGLLLFQSQTTVARRARGMGNLHLQRNGDLLVKNLPLPAAERSRAQFIIHLHKP